MFLSFSAALVWAILPSTSGSDISCDSLVQSMSGSDDGCDALVQMEQLRATPTQHHPPIEDDNGKHDMFVQLQLDVGIGRVSQSSDQRELFYLTASRARMATCHVQAPHISLLGQTPMPGSVLYLIKTYSGAYDTKLRAVMDTWGARVPKSSLLIVGDEPSAQFPIHVAKECGSDAMLGLACRVAHGMELAASTPGNWSWVFVVDDDHYVKTDNLERSLARLDPNVVTGVGCYGCGSGEPFHYCHDKGGFCGGCGYGFSRAAVMKAIKGKEADFRAQHLSVAESKELSDKREDMAMTCTMMIRVPDMKVEPLEGSGIDGDNEKALMEDISRDGCKTQSAIWHWIKPEMMHKLHRLVATDGPGCRSNIE